MRTRTRLTTPPGQEPLDDEAQQQWRHTERYTPFLDRPTEPRWPSRYRGLIVGLTSLLVLLALGYGAYRLSTAGQFEDPSLTEIPGEP